MMQVSLEPITKHQQMLCKKFLEVFGTSIYEVVNTTFFDLERRISLRDASTQFIYNDANFTLSYEILGLDHGFLLACKDGDSAFFAVKNMFLFWQQSRYGLEDFIAALDELSKP